MEYFLEIFKNHIIPDMLCSLGIKKNSLIKNILGARMVFTRNENGVITINGEARIIRSDIVATNGVIHLIDKVLVPARGFVFTEALRRNNFTRYYNLVKSFDGLDGFWNNLKNKTFFVPINEAFDNNMESYLDKTADDETYFTLLNYFISPLMIYSKDFINNNMIDTHIMEKIRLNVYGKVIYFVLQGRKCNIFCFRTLDLMKRIFLRSGTL